MAQNSLTYQLENNNRLQANGLAISQAFYEAVTSNKTSVDLTINNEDGTETVVAIPTNIALHNDFKKVEASLKNIVGLSNDTQNTIISANDGSFRQLYVHNFKKTYDQPKATEISISNQINVDTNHVVKNLLSPLTEIKVSLDKKYLRSDKVNVTKLIVNSGDFSAFSDGETYQEVIQKLATTGYSYETISFDMHTKNRNTRYFGTFNVTNMVVNDDLTINVTLDKLTYSDNENVVSDSRELDVNDRLVTKSGNNRLYVTAVDRVNNIVTLMSEGGFESVKTGVEELSYLMTETQEVRDLHIPVKLNEKSIIFLKIVDSSTQVESTYSQSKIFDSDNYIVIENNQQYTFNEYFASKVVDLGAYFESILRENTIPVALGETPSKPIVFSSNFNVLQINKHLTNTLSAEKIKKFNREKTIIDAEIDVLTNSIESLNSRIAKGNYTTSNEKLKDVALLNSKIRERNSKKESFKTVVNNIQNALANTTSNSVTPKYRVRGFWDVESDLVSNTTTAQKIVQYNIRYRYISNVGTPSTADSMSFIDSNGNSLNGVFSSWNEYKTEPLKKKLNPVTNQLEWEVNSVESIDQQNINQLDIPIRYGESVEFQIQAVSEAGFPTSPITSEWSDLIRVDFPDELTQESDLATIANNNNDDLLKVAVNNEFSTQGITEHVSTAFQEQDKYFAHQSTQIASGFLTDEQKTISLFDYLTTLTNNYNTLKEQIERRYNSLTVQIVDHNNRVYNVNNKGVIDIFAGYYTDDVDITDKNAFGDIVEKTFYIKIVNKNATVIDMPSISTGTLTNATTNNMYSNVGISLQNTDEKADKQLNGQLIYLRNRNVIDDIDLVVSNENKNSFTVVNNVDIDNSALDTQKDVVHNNNSYELVKLTDNASLNDYVVMSNKHPLYIDFLSSNNDTELKAEFERMSKFNDNIRLEQQQSEYDSDLPIEFVQNDKYMIGKNSVGSRLFVKPVMADLQVNGSENTAIRQIHSGETNALLIPIKFQYRMMDILGNVDGDSKLTTNSNLTYTKTIGVDTVIMGEIYKFDIRVSCKFRSTSISNQNITTVTNEIDTTSSQNTNVN